MVPELEISIKISYIDEYGIKKADTATLFYYFKLNISTKNAFLTISEKIKEQLGLNNDEYIFIKYEYGNTLPFNTQSCLPIYKEFNTNRTVPFYIHIKTHEFYLKMINFILQECPICLNQISNSRFISPFRCGHSICNDCYQRCRQTNNNSCCYCRESYPSNTNLIV